MGKKKRNGRKHERVDTLESFICSKETCEPKSQKNWSKFKKDKYAFSEIEETIYRFTEVTVSILKNIHRKKTPWNKTEALTKSMNMYIWEIVTLYQLFKKDFILKVDFQKNEVNGQWQKPILCDKSILYSFCTCNWLIKLYN